MTEGKRHDAARNRREDFSQRPCEITDPQVANKMKSVAGFLWRRLISSGFKVESDKGIEYLKAGMEIRTKVFLLRGATKNYITRRRENYHGGRFNLALKDPVRKIRRAVNRHGYPLEILAFAEAIEDLAKTNDFDEIREKSVAELGKDFFDAAFERLQGQQQDGPGNAR